MSLQTFFSKTSEMKGETSTTTKRKKETRKRKEKKRGQWNDCIKRISVLDNHLMWSFRWPQIVFWKRTFWIFYQKSVNRKLTKHHITFLPPSSQSRSTRLISKQNMKDKQSTRIRHCNLSEIYLAPSTPWRIWQSLVSLSRCLKQINVTCKYCSLNCLAPFRAEYPTQRKGN